MDGQSTPLTPQDRLANELVAMRWRIEELERALRSTTASQDQVAAAVAAAFNAGDIVATFTVVLPTDWSWMDGTSIVNCDTTRPALWANAPVAWRSGTTLNIPDMNGKFLRATTGTPGGTSGSSTVTLAETNLPSHTHSIDHGHGDTLAAPAHTHAIDPPNTSTTSDTHSHTYWSPGNNKFVGNAIQTDAAAVRFVGNTGSDTHSHTVNIAAFTSGGASATALTGSVTDFTGSSGAVGSATPFSIIPDSLEARLRIYLGVAA